MHLMALIINESALMNRKSQLASVCLGCQAFTEQDLTGEERSCADLTSTLERKGDGGITGPCLCKPDKDQQHLAASSEV